MDRVITEKDYPISRLWIVKSIIGGIMILLTIIVPVFISLFRETNLKLDYVVIYLFPIIAVVVIVFLLLFSISALLQRATFHYSVEDKFIVLKQGILSKEQRHIPYDVIQDVLIKQDLLDRLLGINLLIVENAAQGGSDPVSRQVYYGRGGSMRKHESGSIGFIGNKVYIPGLTKQYAEAIKGIILQKAIDNPGRNNNSGL